MSNWSGLDYFIFLFFLMNILLGMARGGLKESISTFGLCAALVMTIAFTGPLTKFVNSSPLMTDVVSSPMVQNFMKAVGMPPLTYDSLVNCGYALSLLICFVGAFGVCEAVLAYSNVMEAFSLPVTLINRKVGVALGALRGFIFTVIFLVVLKHLFMGDNQYLGTFATMFQGPVDKLDYLIQIRAPERYGEILKDSNLYNTQKVLDMVSPK